MNINYLAVFIAISTNNLQSLVNFYRQLFQVEPTRYHIAKYAEFKLEKFRLGLFQPKSDHQTEFNNFASSMSLCIEVKDLAQAIATLVEMGYAPPGEIVEASHGQEIYAYDPE